MIEDLRGVARRLWPVIRLRWLLFGTLLFVAALPGIAALSLRVYENALVRRTEAELIAQASALAASAALLWPGEPAAALPPPRSETSSERYDDTSTEIDLRSSPVLPERPAAEPTALKPDPEAAEVARRMAPAIAETRHATLASILLVDRQGIVLGGRDAGRSLAMLPELRRALAGQANTALRFNDAYGWRYPLRWVSRATDIRLHHVRPIRAGGRIVGAVLVSRSPRALFRGMWEDRGKIAAGTVSIFALLVLLTAVFARAFVRPIEKLSEASRALASGRPAMPRRPTLEVAEIRSLFDDFEAMSAAIARRSRYLRDFAAALSHEFKTPLAGIRGGIELLEDHGAAMSDAQRTRFLANMNADADRLSRLVSRLMELARADMQVADPAARADPAALLARIADAFSSERFSVTLDLPAALPPVAMDSAALETVLETLVDNARGAGASRLAIAARVDDGVLLIDLADDGPGVPTADRERVFDPFFTSKRESGGTGLGLPIARALLEGSRGWLELADSESGARFVVRLPVSA